MSYPIKNLSARRRKILLGFCFGFGFSLIMVFLNSLSSQLIMLDDYRVIILLLFILGWFIWTYYLIRTIQQQQKIKQDQRLNTALNDEYIQHIRLKSFNIAFWIVLISQGFLYVINMFYGLSAELIILTNIFIAVLAACISFLVLDRE
jgi:hypothetical protein